MTTIGLKGDVTSALTVLAPVGIAGILDEAGYGPATFRWDVDQLDAAASVTCSAGSREKIAEAVRAHAERHAVGESWVRARVEGLANAGKGLFSPRSGIAATEWAPYLEQRDQALDCLSPRMSPLDWGLLAALGEPAWWRSVDSQPEPDKGASRWEMKTRNRGEEFIANRLHLLAQAVGARSGDEIERGLIGERQVDECGRDKPTSRTPTGLTVPQATDNALAWAALWGLVALPVVPLSGASVHRGYSQTPGVSPRHRVHPEIAALPVVTRPHTWRSLRALMTTRAFDQAAFGTEPGASVARAWLKEQGVIAIMRYPIDKRGSTAAPERMLLSGTAEVI